MTERLYYSDSFLVDFTAHVEAVVRSDGRKALVLDRTAFYPTSGGQIFDKGWVEANGARFPVSEVVEDETGNILHYIDGDPKEKLEGTSVRGVIDEARRRDHMQQHSGQHILSAAFEKLFKTPTVSFHMGDESCTIDLATNSITDEQIRQAESEANRVVTEDRPVEIRSATAERAHEIGVRKIPDHVSGELRLIDIEGYDLNACGGTHVRRTGQVGPILLRKFEKVKQGFRVEFVCGNRAIATARRDFETLTSAAALFATHIWDVPDLIRKSLDETKQAAKDRKKLLEELAELLALRMLDEAPVQPGFKVITRVFDDRDLNFIKLLAQKITATSPAVALLGTTLGQSGVVFAQSPGLPDDMGALMKEALATLGARGGGNRDLAQGGAADSRNIASVLETVSAKIRR